jgi:hypothetical protein
MCRCDTDECCNLRAEYIDSRIGRLVTEQADPLNPVLCEGEGSK